MQGGHHVGARSTLDTLGHRLGGGGLRCAEFGLEQGKLPLCLGKFVGAKGFLTNHRPFCPATPDLLDFDANPPVVITTIVDQQVW